MNRNKILSRILNGLAFSLVLLISVAVLPLSLPKLLGIQVYGVLTGSMEPEYSVGGVVYVQQCDTAALHIGDVITYNIGSDTESVMTHRIVGVEEETGAFQTKGDANNSVDPGMVMPASVVGKVIFYLPYMAYVATALEKASGIISVVILFIIAVILWMLSDIVKKCQKDLLRPVVRGLSVLLIVGAGGYLGVTYLDAKGSKEEYAALEKQVFAAVEVTGNATNSIASQEAAPTSLSADVAVQNAVAQLKKSNPDTIGWIKFENPDISYPVMQAEDNEFYLRRSFSGERKTAGSIFMDTINHGDFQDAHTIIYGHNMRDLSMFGQLKYYKDEEFYEGNEFFIIYTDSATYRYQIFAYYDVTERDDVYTVWYTNDNNFETEVAEMLEKSYYDTGVEVTGEDKIVTLSTCSTEGNRFVIHAKRVAE